MTTATTIYGSFPASATLVQNLASEGGNVSLFTRFKQVLTDWLREAAALREEARLWDLAQSDSRVMAELMLARKRDDAEDAWVAQSYVSPVAEMEAVPEAMPKQPSLLGQGWAGVIEDAYQTRSQSRRLQIA